LFSNDDFFFKDIKSRINVPSLLSNLVKLYHILMYSLSPRPGYSVLLPDSPLPGHINLVGHGAVHPVNDRVPVDIWHGYLQRELLLGRVKHARLPNEAFYGHVLPGEDLAVGD
jgi:hypothetical protein